MYRDLLRWSRTVSCRNILKNCDIWTTCQRMLSNSTKLVYTDAVSFVRTRKSPSACQTFSASAPLWSCLGHSSLRDPFFLIFCCVSCSTADRNARAADPLHLSSTNFRLHLTYLKYAHAHDTVGRPVSLRQSTAWVMAIEKPFRGLLYVTLPSEMLLSAYKKWLSENIKKVLSSSFSPFETFSSLPWLRVVQNQIKGEQVVLRWWKQVV